MSTRHQSQPPPDAGFTLIEIMVVVAILGMLATLVAVSVGDRAAEAREGTARTQCRLIADAVDLFLVQNGRLPELHELVEPDARNRTYLKRLEPDPWSRDYELLPGDPASRFVVVSLGEDGVAGTDDDIRSR